MKLTYKVTLDSEYSVKTTTIKKYNALINLQDDSKHSVSKQ